MPFFPRCVTLATTNDVTKMQSIMLDCKLMGATYSLGYCVTKKSGANIDCMTI